MVHLQLRKMIPLPFVVLFRFFKKDQVTKPSWFS